VKDSLANLDAARAKTRPALSQRRRRSKLSWVGNRKALQQPRRKRTTVRVGSPTLDRRGGELGAAAEARTKACGSSLNASHCRPYLGGRARRSGSLIFIDLVAQCPNAHPQRFSCARATTVMMSQGVEDKFALDLFDRAANKQSDNVVVQHLVAMRVGSRHAQPLEWLRLSRGWPPAKPEPTWLTQSKGFLLT